MQTSNITLHRKAARGFTLPAILVVVGALLILAVGVLLIAGIERNTSRAFSDRERANLAARAGLEDVKGTLAAETANDDFLVIQGVVEKASGATKEPVPYLYLARGSGGGDNVSHRFLPLFSAKSLPLPSTAGSAFKAPVSEDLVGSSPTSIATLPWLDPAKLAWIEVPDVKGKIISRYAYWVEDLQSRVDAGTAGNTVDAGSHKRYGWKAGDTSKFAKFPAPGLNPEPSSPGSDGRDLAPPLNQVALYALDPAAGAKDESDLDKTIIDGRLALISPDSVLAVAGIAPPLTRGLDGQLVDLKARALERNLTASVQPYDEQPLVPFAKGIATSVGGKPKLNLNALLAKPPETAVDEMAAWIKQGLPAFEDRKGGFPDDYIKTLAANAIDYADADVNGTVSPGSIMGSGSYRGLDAYPLMSEVILHLKYTKAGTVKGRRVLRWEMIVYAELWNHTNLPVNGSARISYENGMRPPAIGAGVVGDRFDDPVLMNDTNQVKHSLTRIGNRYWSAPIPVNLLPNQYKFYKAATINYTLDVGPSSQALQGTFNIFEDLGSSGISMMWNEKEVDRNDKLVRGNSSPDNPELEYQTNTDKQSGKANIPGHSYGPYNNKKPYPDYRNNMGDSRQALYLRGATYPLADNSYPGNVSPNRRNIRNVSIYKNGQGQTNVYGRVLPSEWPDGGHDVPVSGLSTAYSVVVDYDPTDPLKFPDFTGSLEGESPTFISNRGRFYSVTELGRIFDPIMFIPKYDNNDDTTNILRGSMPSSRVSWPSVEIGSTPDIYYGGGNTLRIGRPEHPNFDQPARHAPAEMPGKHAARLLDLFHVGKSRSETQADREGPLVRIEGHVNINTASEDAIRALVVGKLVSDPRLVKRTSETHSTSTFAPPVSALEIYAPTSKEANAKEGDLLAKAIIQGRPFSSPSEIASVLSPDGKVVCGNKFLYPYTPNPNKPDISQLQWSDAAAEEVFARVYESSTIRSRNFRVWVIGQAISPTAANNPSPEVLSEVRKVFNIFADPGVRKSDGSVDKTKFHTKVLHENDF